MLSSNVKLSKMQRSSKAFETAALPSDPQMFNDGKRSGLANKRNVTGSSGFVTALYLRKREKNSASST